MDQLKSILALLQKHHFWLLAVVCMISAVVAWMKAASSLSDEYTKKKGAIVSAFSGLATIETTPNFPNAKWKEEVDKLTRQEREQVKKAWEQLYSEQQKILKWPAVLGTEFLEAIAKIPPGGEIPQRFRDTYALKIGEEIHTLLAIIKATPEMQSKEGSTPPPRVKDGEPRVAWADQIQVQRLLDFKGVAPAAAEIWQAQEDLWVYASVLMVISAINGDEYVLRVPRIDSLLIGSKAADALERGMKPGHIEAVAAPQSTDGEGAGGGGGGAALPDDGPAPADQGRYVDATGKPLAGGAPPQEQFKRMPVFLKLSIDERAIPKLLAECANSTLPIEVRQLRINPSKSGATRRTPGSDASPSGAESSYNVPLELSGIIYIYNPPDKTKLGGDQPTASADAAPPPAAGPGG